MLAAVGIIGHLDGSGATTFIITITAMLPLFKKLKMDNRALMLLVCVAIGVMNVCPWGGPTIRAATVLESDPNILWHRLFPVQGAMLVITFVVAFLQSGLQKRRIAKLGATADDTVEDLLKFLKNMKTFPSKKMKRAVHNLVKALTKKDHPWRMPLNPFQQALVKDFYDRMMFTDDFDAEFIKLKKKL